MAPLVSFRGGPWTVELDGWPTPCPDLCGPRSARLGGPFVVSDGGKITGKPGECGDEEVVTGAVLVAIVAADVGSVIEAGETPSEPLTELEGLAVEVELSSEARGERMEKERRLSLSGLTSGDGMLMFWSHVPIAPWQMP